MRLSECVVSIAMGAFVLFEISPVLASAEAYCQKRFLVERSLQNQLIRHSRQRLMPKAMMSSPAPAARVQTAQPKRPDVAPPLVNRNRYRNVEPNAIQVTATAPVSTFSADVDTASYALVRRYLTKQKRLPPADAVRPEELINAFDYAYAPPMALSEAFRPEVAIFPSPWNETRTLMRIGIKAYAVPDAQRPQANLVFLLDVSGSMSAMDKLPLAKTAICLLVHELKPTDRIALVVYAGAAGVVLEPTEVKNKSKIFDAMDVLSAGGSTAGGQGIELAYALAETHRQPGAANRIILATDGDFNVGIADPRALRDYVARKRQTGVFLTVLGLGLGNYNDELMQSLAQAGNGVAAYIDGVDEIRKVLIRGLTGSIVTVAKDVKFQIEFNPARVAEYRLIGYETRALDETDFKNDRVDAGDVGSGHTVTALYELSMVGASGQAREPRHFAANVTRGQEATADLAFLRIRFKAPEAQDSRLIERAVTEADVFSALKTSPEEARFAAAVAWFAQALRNGVHVAPDWKAIQHLAEGALGSDPYGDRRNFVALVREAEKVAAVE